MFQLEHISTMFQSEHISQCSSRNTGAICHPARTAENLRAKS
jgi:hypothetical protein